MKDTSLVHSDTDSDAEASPTGSQSSSFFADPFNSKPPGVIDDDRHEVPQRLGDFVLLTQHKLDDAPITVYKWQSEASGLKVVWADTPNLVSTFATTVVTEIFNDLGCPHTLEHLTFTASEHFPYNSVLYKIAGRLMSANVNASTDFVTTYTFESASAEGMLEVVPVYLDHIFFPLMTESIFKTEIYHVNGHGEEGGTVFSEMQGTEGSPGEVMWRAASRALYDKLNGYRSETGGLLKNLRKLTLEQIIAYHKQAYVPQNVTVVLTGRQIDPRELLDTISRNIEPRLARAGLARGPHPKNWIRPYVQSSTAQLAPVISKDQTIPIFWADTASETGEVVIVWIGPEIRDSLAVSALKVLGSYLVNGTSAILRKKFAESTNPACADLAFDIFYRDPAILRLDLGCVNNDRLQTLAEEVKKTLAQHCRERLDMKAIRLVLHERKMHLERKMETKPATYVQDTLMTDIIYGAEDGSELGERFNDLGRLEELSKWKEDDWKHLFKEYLVDRPSIVLVGAASPELAKQQAQEDEARVKDNVRAVGHAGLAALGKILQKAEKANSHTPPAGLLDRYPVPDAKKISWIDVETARSNGIAQGRQEFSNKVQQIINSDRCELPLFVQFDDVKSNFVKVSVFLHGPAQPIAALYVDTFFSMPVETSKHRMLSYDDVSREMDGSFVRTSAELSHEGILVSLTSSREDYAKTVGWLSDLLHGTTFDLDRLKVLVARELATLPETKERGDDVASAVLASLGSGDTSYETMRNPLNQLRYYTELKHRLEEEPKSVINELRKFRKTLLDPRSMRFSVIGDISSLDKPASTWKERFETSVKPLEGDEHLVPLTRSRDVLSDLGRSPANKAILYELDNSESTFLASHSPCPDWNSSDYPALAIAATLLSKTDGLIWQATRTKGLCYGAWITLLVEKGFVQLDIYRSPDAIVALSAIRKLIKSIVKGSTKIDKEELDAVKSEIAFGCVEQRSTPSQAAWASFYDGVLLNKPADYPRQFLNQIQLVTPDQVRQAVRNWILPLFDSSTSNVGAASGRRKTGALVAGLKKLGYNVEERHF